MEDTTYNTHNNINTQMGLGMTDIDMMGSALDMHIDNNFIEVEEESIAQSSIMESELDYTNHGNIRASTYKRNADT